MRTVDEVVGANIRRLREQQGISFRGMSAELKKHDAPIFYNVLPTIERGERPVRASELVAFAMILGVTPITLLMPDVEQHDSPAGDMWHGRSGSSVWHWLKGELPLTERTPASTEDFRRASMPRWLWPIESTPLMRAVRGLLDEAIFVAAGVDRGEPSLKAMLRKAVRRAVAEVDAATDGGDDDR